MGWYKNERTLLVRHMRKMQHIYDAILSDERGKSYIHLYIEKIFERIARAGRCC